MKLCRETGEYFEESVQGHEDVKNLEILPQNNKQLRIVNSKSLQHVTYLWTNWSAVDRLYMYDNTV